jgi:hypothetical protein
MTVHFLWRLTAYGVIKQNGCTYNSEVSYSKAIHDLMDKIEIRKKAIFSALGWVETSFFISVI